MSVKKIIILVTFLVGSWVMAQQSTSKQINQIKRNPLYLYSEATMDTEDEAHKIACEMLLQQVKEYIASRKTLTGTDNILIKDIKTKSESLMMRRGAMYRVFVYVSKIDIEAVDNVTTINITTGTTTSTNKVMSKVTEVESSVESKQEEYKEAEKDENVVPNTNGWVEPETMSMSKPALVVEDEEMQATLSTEVISANMQSTNLPKWQQQAIETLLRCDNLFSIQSKLSRLKSEYKISRYGTPDKCRSVENSYWIIFDDDGKLITILGEGKNERVDYSSMQTSSLEKYKGMNALWFNFAK